MEFEQVLKQVGDFGKFLKCLIYLFLIPVSAMNILYDRIFMWTTPDHWCRVKQLDHLSPDLQKLYISPETSEQGLSSHDKCRMYDIDYDMIPNSSIISMESLNKSITKKCQNGWTFDRSVFEETAVTQFEFVCDNAYYVSLIMSIGPIGTMIMTPVFSFITDRIGRKQSFLYVNLLLISSLISPIVLRDAISFSICYIIESSLFVSYYQIPFIMGLFAYSLTIQTIIQIICKVMEFVGTEYRSRTSSMSAIAYSIGGCILPIISYFTGHWVKLAIAQLAMSFPILIIWKFLPESPSWLITQKRYIEACDVLDKVAKWNGVTPQEDIMCMIQKVGQKEEEKKERINSTLDFIRISELRKRLMILVLLFVANVLAYSGLALNSLNFHGNELINYFLLSLCDIPATLISWYLIEGRLGRRWTNTMALMLCGITLCIPVLLSSSQKAVIILFSLLGKGGTAASFVIMYQQAAEIFPTTLRSEGLGICSTFGSLAAIIVPYVSYLGRYGLWIPMCIMGSVCMIAGIASSFLPETLNENLPQNSKESETFGKNKPYFSLAKISFDTKL